MKLSIRIPIQSNISDTISLPHFSLLYLLVKVLELVFVRPSLRLVRFSLTEADDGEAGVKPSTLMATADRIHRIAF